MSTILQRRTVLLIYIFWEENDFILIQIPLNYAFE